VILAVVQGPTLKRDILSRYERDDAGNSIIDVAAARVENLYNDFDKSAPYIRRDLDGDLAEYLTGCARELGKAPFVIRFTLVTAPDKRNLSRIRRSLKSYFQYCADLEGRKIYAMARRSAIFLAIGLAILLAISWLDRQLGPDRSIAANVFGEGLTIVAWISLWEALATFLVEWVPQRRNVSLYRRLAHASLVFRVAPQGEAER